MITIYTLYAYGNEATFPGKYFYTIRTYKLYTGKNATDLLQIVNFTGLSTSYKKLVNFIELQQIC